MYSTSYFASPCLYNHSVLGFLCVFCFVCVRVCMCVSVGMHMVYRGQSSVLSVFLGFSSPYFWNSFSLNLELAGLACLQRSSHWDYRHTLTSGRHLGPEDWAHAYIPRTLQTEPFLQALCREFSSRAVHWILSCRKKRKIWCLDTNRTNSIRVPEPGA